MKKNILITIPIIFLFHLSCKNDKNINSATSQMKEVMAIHDEVMPKMGEIGSLVSKLKKKIDTDLGGAAEKKAMEDLQDAHKSMMDWMRDFGDKFEPDEILNGKELTSKKQELLNQEEESVKIVKEKINSSIANAKALLEETD